MAKASKRRIVASTLIALAIFALAIYSAARFSAREAAAKSEIYNLEWLSMGTRAAFLARSEEDLSKAREVKAVFAEIERLLSAHDENSELRKLAHLPDDEILSRADPLVRPCYEAAFRFRDSTSGAFDPRWRGPGTMDLGAIAKGFALDLAAQKIGEVDALIDLGGNLKALGGEWKVGVEGAPDAFTLRKGQACATSGEYHRGKHIKDARTGEDAIGEAFSVSVITQDSAMEADALSTILFIFGREKGEEFVRADFPGATTIWVEKGATSSTEEQFRAR